VEAIHFVTEEGEGTSFRVKSDEFFVNLADELDVESEKENLQKELEYTQGFLDSVIKKLSNERFVQNAKGDVVEKERQKQADAESKIETLREALARLN
jgi:valyl-tRNA synthetase